MTKLTMEQLITAANELDALMGLDLLPPVEDEDQEALETWIKDASEELHGDDTVSDETETVLEELDVWIAPEDRVDKEDEDEKGTKDEADDGGGQDLSAEVDTAESLKELREIVKANDEFKSLRGLMTKYKAGSEEDLKEEMLDLLEPDAEPKPKEEKKPETKRKTPSGKDEVPIPKKGSAKMEVVPTEKKASTKTEGKGKTEFGHLSSTQSGKIDAQFIGKDNKKIKLSTIIDNTGLATARIKSHIAHLVKNKGIKIVIDSTNKDLVYKYTK